MSVRHLVLNKRVVAATAIPAAVIASGGMVWASPYSAFSATTASPTNNWTSGTVALGEYGEAKWTAQRHAYRAGGRRG